MSETSYSKLVDGYKRAFIDSSVEAEPAFTPQFISNYRGNKVLSQLENELRECSSMFMSVAFITGGGIAHLKGVLKEMEAKKCPRQDSHHRLPSLQRTSGTRCADRTQQSGS